MLIKDEYLESSEWFKSPEPGIYVSRVGGAFVGRNIWNECPVLSNDIWNYGVCDNYQQLLDKCPEIVNSNERQFIVTLFQVDRDDQDEEGGWRWHKWGDYIGDETPTCEYLYDEPDIDRVYCYQVYEKVVK